MKKIILFALPALALGMLSPQIIQAQGTTYLSNLEQSSTGSQPVGSDSWLAVAFVPGTNAGGYVINSIQLTMSNASGNPSGFQVMLYRAGGGGGEPGALLGTLNGSLNPVTAGIYTYTPTATLTLPIRGIYDIVLTAGTAVADGAYQWSGVGMNPFQGRDDWNTLGAAGGFLTSSSNGSLLSWIHNPLGSPFPQFAIDATAVPEPGVLSLFVLGGFLLVRHRRKAKAFYEKNNN